MWLMLMSFFLEADNLPAAKNLWSEVRQADIIGTEDYYVLGLLFARAIGNRKLEESLNKQSGLLQPDSLPLLQERVKFYTRSGRHQLAFEELEEYCRTYTSLNQNGCQDELREFATNFFLYINEAYRAPVGKYLKAFLIAAPSQLCWDLRIEPRLWHFLPTSRITPEMSSLPVSETPEVAASLMAARRYGLAEQLLRERISENHSSEEKVVLMNLLGDSLLIQEKVTEAGEVYFEALELVPVDSLIAERLSVKAGISFFKSRADDRFNQLYEHYGPKLALVRDDPPSQAEGQKEKVYWANVPSELHDRAQGILMFLKGFLDRSKMLMSMGYYIWSNADGLYLSGEDQSVEGLVKTLAELATAITEVETSEKSALIHFNKFLDAVTKVYLEQKPIFDVVERTLGESLANKEFTAYTYALMASSMLEETLGEQAECHLIRLRSKVLCTSSTEAGHYVLMPNEAGPTDYGDFYNTNRSLIKNSHPAVYLRPLTAQQVEAEVLFRIGMIKAYREYKLYEGSLLIKQSLDLDQNNVFALGVLAQIQYVLGITNEATKYINRALDLDPDWLFLKNLADIIED